MDSWSNFKYVRRLRCYNRWLQVVLCLTLAIGLNYLAAQFYWRQDFARYQPYALAPETVAYLQQLQQPVEIIVTLSPYGKDIETQAFYDDVQQLLQEISYSSRSQGNSLIKIIFVDIHQQRKKAQELQNKYSALQENTILVASENRQHQILLTDLYESENGRITAFKGEQEIISAILNVSSSETLKVVFTTGHGEMAIDRFDPESGLSQAAESLWLRNITVETLDLSSQDSIAADVDLIIIPGPQTTFLRQEMNLLRQYLNKNNGKLILYLNSDIESHGLEEMLLDWGILADDKVIIDHGPDYQSTTGDFIIRRFAEHPITAFLINHNLTVLAGLCRPARPDPGAPLDARLNITPLLASSDTSWAESAYRQQPAAFDPISDLPGPVSIGVIAEQNLGQPLGLALDGGSIIVFGNSDLISNAKFNLLGNKMLFLNAVKWSINKNTSVKIPPRTIESYQLLLSQQDLLHIALKLFLIPIAIALLGLVVFFFRRR